MAALAARNTYPRHPHLVTALLAYCLLLVVARLVAAPRTPHPALQAAARTLAYLAYTTTRRCGCGNPVAPTSSRGQCATCMAASCTASYYPN